MDKTRFRYGLGVLAGTALLSAFWVVPFLFNHQYMTDMKYGFRPDGPTDSFWKMFFQYPPFWDILVNGLAIIGFVLAIVRRQLVGVWLGLLCLALMALTYITRGSLPVIGLLWNPRLLPFLYLTRLLLMMVGIVELVHYVLRNWQHVRALSPRTQWIAGRGHGRHGRRHRPHRRAVHLPRGARRSLRDEERQERVLVGHRRLRPDHAHAARRRTPWPTAGRGTTSRATRVVRRTASTRR